jgi:CRP-like cAMP-binding protein
VPAPAPRYVAGVDASRLAAIPLFADLDEDDLASISASAIEVEADEGETLATQGDLGHALFAIESGTVEVTANGERLATLGPGDVFGEMAVVAAGIRMATVVATSPVRLIAMLKRDVWALEQRSPETAARLRELLVSRRG